MKYENLVKEDFKRKEYFYQLNLEQIRERFRLQTQMYGEFKGSFPSKYKKRGMSLKCEMCKNLLDSNTTLDVTSNENTESQAHYLEICPGVSDLREQYDTCTDLGLIHFFRLVLERRTDMVDN